jgi:exonuclease VII small subunit
MPEAQSKIMIKPLPEILDELEGGINRLETAIKASEKATKEAKAAAVEAREAGVKAAGEAGRVAEQAIANLEKRLDKTIAGANDRLDKAIGLVELIRATLIEEADMTAKTANKTMEKLNPEIESKGSNLLVPKKKDSYSS